jgi:hypothetical protein
MPRKRVSVLGGGLSPLGHLPPPQETEEAPPTTDPIPIKKVAMESCSEKISVCGSDCQGKGNLSRSFEESRPRLSATDRQSSNGARKMYNFPKSWL